MTNSLQRRPFAGNSEERRFVAILDKPAELKTPSFRFQNGGMRMIRLERKRKPAQRLRQALRR